MFYSPMLLQYAKNNEPFNHPDWIGQLKLDGIRLEISNMDRLKLYTRHNNDVTDRYKELHNGVPNRTVLDGELIVEDEHGRPDFFATMERFQSKRSKQRATYCVFDVIISNGIDVTGLPLMKRLEILDRLEIDNDHIKKCAFVEGDLVKFYDIVRQQKLEGCVLKHNDSKYVINHRTDKWLKVIAYEQAEVFISGYSKDKFGWLISLLEGDKLRNVGVMELGVGEKERKAAFPLLKQMAYKEHKNMVFVEPKIRCRVKYREWTKNGMMRLPVFEGFIL